MVVMMCIAGAHAHGIIDFGFSWRKNALIVVSILGGAVANAMASAFLLSWLSENQAPWSWILLPTAVFTVSGVVMLTLQLRVRKPHWRKITRNLAGAAIVLGAVNSVGLVASLFCLFGAPVQ